MLILQVHVLLPGQCRSFFSVAEIVSKKTRVLFRALISYQGKYTNETYLLVLKCKNIYRLFQVYCQIGSYSLHVRISLNTCIKHVRMCLNTCINVLEEHDKVNKGFAVLCASLISNLEKLN